MSVMLLAAEPGSEVELVAEGPQAEQVADTIEKLFKARFNEEEA